MREGSRPASQHGALRHRASPHTLAISPLFGEESNKSRISRAMPWNKMCLPCDISGGGGGCEISFIRAQRIVWARNNHGLTSSGAAKASTPTQLTRPAPWLRARMWGSESVAPETVGMQTPKHTPKANRNDIALKIFTRTRNAARKTP